MAKDVYVTVAQCTKGVHTQETFTVVLCKRNLEFVAMEIFGPLPKNFWRNQFVLVITDLYSMRTSRTTTFHVAKPFMDHWICPFGIPTYLLSDNGPQFLRKFFQSLSSRLGIKHLTTTLYHPQTNGRGKRFNKIILTRMRHSVVEHLRNRDVFVQPLTYAHNTQVHRSTNK